MNDDIVLSLKGVRFRPDGASKAVLDGIDLEVRRGEWILVIGPSGSGKTTLALCLNGIVPHSETGEFEGEVVVNGLLTTETPVAQMATSVGMVFQDPDAQIVHEIVRDEVYFGLENLREDPEVIVPAAHAALETVGMLDYLNAEVMSLSGGQKQRVSLASVLSFSPDIIVLDEPTANLDPQGMRDVFNIIERLHKERNMTVIMIEHHVDELVEKVDRVVVLDKGRVLRVDTPARIFTDMAPHAQQQGLWLPQATELAHGLDIQLTAGLLPISVPACIEQVDDMLRQQNVKGGDDFPRLAIARLPEAEEPLLEIRNFRFAYRGGGAVLKDVSLKLDRGGITAILGPNGSGKTTLAKSITRINQPPAGSIFLHGADIVKMSQPELTRRVGYVFQNPDHQFVTDRTYDELAYSLRVRKMDPTEIDRRVREMLDIMELSGREDDSPSGLSVGERRRLSVATMLILEQDLVILDEPTIGQDLARSQTLFAILDRLCKEQGTTMIFITHDMRLVADWCPRSIVLTNGVIRYDGPTVGIFEDPHLLTQAHLVAPPMVEISEELRQRGHGIPRDTITVPRMCDFVQTAYTSQIRGIS